MAQDRFVRQRRSRRLKLSPRNRSRSGVAARSARTSSTASALIARWPYCGRVHGLGVVVAVDASKTQATVEWQRTTFTLHPSPQGRTRWLTRPYFMFDPKVAARYRLPEYFTDTPKTAGVTVSAPVRHAAPPAAPRPVIAVTRPMDTAGRVPQRNRVDPNGEVFATAARGLFMGNRAYGLRWLVCELHFERGLTTPRVYPKVFFLDESVALAAGHRPCKTCRSEYYSRFPAAARGDRGDAITRAEDLDKQLHTVHTVHATLPQSIRCVTGIRW